MPINANNMIVGKKKEPEKAPRTLTSSIKAAAIVVKKPKETKQKPIITQEKVIIPPKKYEDIENGELIRKINIKSGYMRDVFNIK